MRLFELPGTFSIAHQHSLQLVPPLDAMLQLSIVVCYSRELILRALPLGEKYEMGISFAHLNQLPDCISELPSTFSIAHQHFLQHVPPLDAMLQLSYVTREN